MTCTFSDIDKILAKFQKDPSKLKEELRSQDTQCLYAMVEAKPK